MRKVFRFLYLFICFCVLLTVPAYANYIDPSAVTYTAQAIAAVVVALGALATVFRHKLTAIFKKSCKDTAKREIHVYKEDSSESSSDISDTKD